MKQTATAILCLAVFAAHAGGHSTPPKSPAPTANATAIAGAAAVARSTSSATGGTGGSATITGAMGVSGGTFGGAGGSVGDGAGSINIGAGGSLGGVQFAKSAPAAIAPDVSQPAQSCRLSFSLAGSNSSGGLGGGIPLGNDATCLAIMRDALMKGDAAFSADDRLRNKCTVEGMGETSACKALAKRDAEASRASAILEDRPALAQQPAPWQAGG